MIVDSKKIQIRDGWALFLMIAVVGVICWSNTDSKSVNATPPPYRESAIERVVQPVQPTPQQQQPQIIYIQSQPMPIQSQPPMIATNPPVTINNNIIMGRSETPLVVQQAQRYDKVENLTRCDDLLAQHNARVMRWEKGKIE